LAEAKATLDALDRVYAYLREDDRDSNPADLPGLDSLEMGQSPLIPMGGKQDGPKSNSGRSGTIRTTQEVRDAIDQFHSTFTQQDITRRIQKKHPRADVRPAGVANTLARMAKRGSIKLVRKGYGSEPNAYIKTEAWAAERSLGRGLPVAEEHNE
jgi:hypothetical protein